MFEPVSEWVRGRLLRFLGLQGTVIRCKGPALRSCLFARSVQIASTVELGGWNRIDDCCQLLGLVRVGAYSTLASGVVLHGGRSHGTIEVGRYTQLGPQVTVWALNHNINRISAYNGRLLFDGKMKNCQSRSAMAYGWAAKRSCWLGSGSGICQSSEQEQWSRNRCRLIPWWWETRAA